MIGTRPEAIKLAPVAHALRARGIEPRLLFTGQHPDLDPSDYGLGDFAAIHLHCAGETDPHVHVGTVSKALLPVVIDSGCRLLIVQGDTSSALGGALAGQMAGIPVAHVEAGLRSHDRRRPWPEEEFRVAIDAQAELLFAPTELSAANLRREHVRGQVHVTGNTGIDSLLALRHDQPCPTSAGPPCILVTCHRRENWGLGIAGMTAALRNIASSGIARVEILLHPNPALARQVRDLLAGERHIDFRQPCSHPETVTAMLESDLVLSDSGGMQEEAAALGVPLLVLRDRTERPEAIACGNVELVGTDRGRIIEAVERQLSGPLERAATMPFGDGRAGERIAEVIEQWLAQRGAVGLSPISSTFPRKVGNW
ncbi:MAG TPA: UDP-N-acetylglucosamine 2-epimerase (non-hydrolyzing) [Sphingomicrobium sp.]|nr:UDP-N-acetylglucosamine 2-epimerase (non-hydrolyzing) [Sphingomicrobium sp.]